MHPCRSIQSWKLADIKRDDYAPNTPGQRQWEMDRKKWLAQRLVDVVKVGCSLDSMPSHIIMSAATLSACDR